LNDSSRRAADVPAAAAGERLDRWLSAKDEDLSRSRVQALIELGLVLVDGRVRPASHRLRGGERVLWELPPTEETDILPDPSVRFSIVHEDEDLAVIDKPAGLVVHPAPGHRSGTLVNGLLARLNSLSSVGGRARPGLVHRLDRETSGLLVVAKNDRAHAALSEQLKLRTLGRDYVALAFGRPAQQQGTLEFPLGRHPRDRKRRAVVEGGRPARTDYRVEAVLAGACRLRLSLHTGRTHQIRVHLSHVGHPVLGDTLYHGGRERGRGAAEAHRARLTAAIDRLGRQALHAVELHLKHPATGDRMSFHSPLPAEMLAAEEILRERD